MYKGAVPYLGVKTDSLQGSWCAVGRDARQGPRWDHRKKHHFTPCSVGMRDLRGSGKRTLDLVHVHSTETLLRHRLCASLPFKGRQLVRKVHVLCTLVACSWDLRASCAMDDVISCYLSAAMSCVVHEALARASRLPLPQNPAPQSRHGSADEEGSHEGRGQGDEGHQMKFSPYRAGLRSTC